jgi:hypothetical protein
MRDLDGDVRADGPALVWHGPEGAPTVLVLDPGGETKHGELPATWRPLAEHLRVGWYRLPAVAADSPTVDELLAGLDGVHLLTSGRAAQPALRLVARRRDRIRSVIVFDPAPPEGEQEDWWDTTTEALRRELTGQHVVVRAFVTRPDDSAARLEPPVPLGHPDVVGRFVQTLVSVEPEHEDVAADWRRVRELVGDAVRRARS